MWKSYAHTALVSTVLALAFAICVWLWWLWRRRRLHRPRFPIVLAHGLMGFDEIVLIGRSHHYFRGVPAHLSKLGVAVYHPRVAGSAPIASRAQALCAHVRALSEPRVNLIAHSMGGLDARYAITHLGLADRVASLTTIGTPHHGTPLAEIGTQVGEKLKLSVLRDILDIEGFWDLTPKAMAEFNRQTPDAPGVFYACVLAYGRPPLMNPLLVPTYAYLRLRYGKNDGVVPVSAQRWGTVIKEIRADHWAQIGWSIVFDVRKLFLELMKELRARGF